MARPLYCSADAALYYPEPQNPLYDLGYMGTYSADRQTALERLLLEPAHRWQQGRFVVAGAQYPAALQWPDNVERIEHLPPAAHRGFYNAQRFTLNITRVDMLRTGYAPSVRLFEAAACATPIISDYWPGLESFFTPGREILISQSPQDTLRYLRHSAEAERRVIGACAHRRVLAEHTAARRAETLERYVLQALAARRAPASTLQTHFTNPRTPLEQQIAKLGPWFHNLHLADGSQTAPDHPLGDFLGFKKKYVPRCRIVPLTTVPSCESRAGQKWPSSSIALRLTLATGGFPIMPPLRRCYVAVVCG
jgi:hypothetical protein